MATRKKNVKSASLLKTDKEKPRVSQEDRERMIRVAAYYRAEKNSFLGDSREFWFEAEREIDSRLT